MNDILTDGTPTAETTADDTPVIETPNWVQVTVLGGDVHNIDVTEGKTIAQALQEAGITVEKGQSITVNGQPVTDTNQALEAGTVVSVVRKLRNGAI
jgi:hypothetical protein